MEQKHTTNGPSVLYQKLHAAQEIFRKGFECYKNGQCWEANIYFEQAADAGYPPADWCLRFLPPRTTTAGQILWQAKKPNNSAKELSQLFNQQDPEVQYDLALYNEIAILHISRQGGHYNNYPVVGFLEQAAGKGHAEAQLWLGKCYLEGYGVEKNIQKAASFFHEAAAQGNFLAASYLSLCCLQDGHVAKVHGSAESWLRVAQTNKPKEIQRSASSVQNHASVGTPLHQPSEGSPPAMNNQSKVVFEMSPAAGPIVVVGQHEASQQFSGSESLLASSSQNQTPTQAGSTTTTAAIELRAPQQAATLSRRQQKKLKLAAQPQLANTEQPSVGLVQAQVETVTTRASISPSDSKDEAKGYKVEPNPPTVTSVVKKTFSEAKIAFKEGTALYVAEEYADALKCFHEAAEQYPLAYVALGLLYAEGGKGIQLNREESKKNYNKARQSNAMFKAIERTSAGSEQYYWLGVYYQFVAKNNTKMLKCYYRAADKNQAGTEGHKLAAAALEKLRQRNQQLAGMDIASSSSSIIIPSSSGIESVDREVETSSPLTDKVSELNRQIISSAQEAVKIEEISTRQVDHQNVAADISVTTPLSLQVDTEVVSETNISSLQPEPDAVVAETKVAKPEVFTKIKKPEDHFNDGFDLYQQDKPQEALFSFLQAAKNNYQSACPFLCMLYAGGPKSAENDPAKSEQYREKAKQERQRLKKNSKENARASKQCYLAFYYQFVEGNLEQAAIWYGKAKDGGNKHARRMLASINTQNVQSIQDRSKVDNKETQSNHHLSKDSIQIPDLPEKILQSVFAGRGQEAKQYPSRFSQALENDVLTLDEFQEQVLRDLCDEVADKDVVNSIGIPADDQADDQVKPDGAQAEAKGSRKIDIVGNHKQGAASSVETKPSSIPSSFFNAPSSSTSPSSSFLGQPVSFESISLPQLISGAELMHQLGGGSPSSGQKPQKIKSSKQPKTNVKAVAKEDLKSVSSFSSASKIATSDNQAAWLAAEEVMKKGIYCVALCQYTTAREHFLRVAGPDCPQAYLYLGNIYQTGYGIPKNIEQGKIYYQNAQAIIALFEKDPNNPRKRFYMGVYHDYVTKNHKQAVEHFSFADIHGEIDATYLLALRYFVDTLGVKKSPQKAVELLQKAIKHPNARYELVRHYLSTTPKKAEEELRKGVALQEPLCQSGLALFYSSRAQKNWKEIVKLFEAAATQGDVIAQCYTGECYLNGHGVDENVDTAITWFIPAAEQGHAKVQFELGKVHLRSIGDKKPNYEEAVKWLKLAATQAHGEACFTLGKIYFVGIDGKNPDYEEAEEWFGLAVEHGYLEALRYLRKCQLKSEVKEVEAKGHSSNSSVQLIDQVELGSPSLSPMSQKKKAEGDPASMADFLLSPVVELSSKEVEGFLFSTLRSKVERTRGAGPKGLPLRKFSSSSGSSDSVAPNCVDKSIVDDKQEQAKPKDKGAIALPSSNNSPTDFFKRNKKPKNKEKVRDVSPGNRSNHKY